MSQLTVAVSEKTFQDLFAILRDSVKESTQGSKDLGPFTVKWNIGFRLEEGTLELQNNGTVKLSELDVVYDPLKITLGLDIPKVCVGGFCIIPSPWGCILRAPRICVFEADPDVSLPLDLGGIIESEISGGFSIKTKYFVDPGRTSAMTNLDAEDAGVPNMWRLHLDPNWLDLDPLDIPDIVGNVLDAAIDFAIDSLLGGLPGWAKDLIKKILGSLVDLIRKILDIADDVQEWLSNLLGVSIGLLNWTLQIVAEYFASKYPIFAFEDPFPILGYKNGLIPVKIPVLNPGVTITDDEMIIGADVG